MTVDMVLTWLRRNGHSAYFLKDGRLLYKDVQSKGKAVAFTEYSNHMYLYSTAVPFANMQVRPVKTLPELVLPTTKQEKTPPFSEWQEYDKLKPGWFCVDDLQAVREALFQQNIIPKVSVSHKHELRKLSVQLAEGKGTIVRLADHAHEIKTFLERFGIEYYGCGLPGAVSLVLEKLLRPNRSHLNAAARQAQYEKQNHRCAICDAELRVGEDHGDHIETLRDAVAGQPQVFRLLCHECN